jgi:tetratricopeptide (TPR) repeat protein
MTLAMLRAAAERLPSSARAWGELGAALRERREMTEAIACFRRAAAAEPAAVAPYVALGEALVKTGAYEEGADAYRRALACAPNDADVLCALADLSVRVLDRDAEARDLCVRGLAARPGDASLHEHLAVVCLRDGGDADPDRVAARIAALLPHGPDRAAIERGVIAALLRAGQYAAARQRLERCCRQPPTDARTLTLLARTEHALGATAAARAHFARARPFALAGGHADALYECLQFAWRTGDYAAARAIVAASRSDASRHDAAIDGAGASASLEGRTILVENDDGGGYGDWILWGRIVALLRRAGARVLLESRAPLQSLLRSIPGVDDVVVPFDECPPYDERASISTLMTRLGWPLADLEGHGAYLCPPAALVAQWRTRVAAHGRGLHVGVDWRTNGDLREQDPYTRRALPLQSLHPLTQVPGVVAHALHVGAAGLKELPAASPAVPLAPLSRDITDFLDTAAAIAALDVIVTVDTAVAHVAGALGKPAIVMLPCYPDWRWGDRYAPFPWYATVRRVQQTAPGDWAPAVREASQALAQMRGTVGTAAH